MVTDYTYSNKHSIQTTCGKPSNIN